MLSSYANYGYEILEHSNHYEYWGIIGIIRSLPEHPLISNPYRGRELRFAFSSCQTPNQTTESLTIPISISYPWNQPYILNSRGRAFV